jgi:hypothetical protein
MFISYIALQAQKLLFVTEPVGTVHGVVSLTMSVISALALVSNPSDVQVSIPTLVILKGLLESAEKSIPLSGPPVKSPEESASAANSDPSDETS